MKKIILLAAAGLLTFAQSAYAQTQIDNRGRSLREISDDVQFEIGKHNKKLEFTDKKSFYGHCNLDWRSSYQAELAYKTNDSTIQTLAVKMSYADTLTHQTPFDLVGLDQKLELCQEYGNLYIFRYEKIVGKDNVNRKKLEKNEDKRKEYVEGQLKRFPGCSIEPMIAEGWSDRILVARFYYDFHHFMWRQEAADNDFLAKQRKEDVVVTSGVSKKAASVLGILRYFADDSEWNPVQVETDSANYAMIYTSFEGRNCFYLFYMENGKLLERRLIPRQEAEFSNIKFTAEYSKDVLHIDVSKGVVDLKVYKAISGTDLTKNPKTAIRWKGIFGETPGEDYWERVGIVDL
ncbi:MAG: hypothetical protein LBR70_05130 [Lactobacillaceae bacterium]|jgi:hypothetical protein|nr:hypothetical protein [Lactobacillaceae bacterium]